MKFKPRYLLLLTFPMLAFFAIAWYQFTGLKLHFFHESAYPLLYSETNIDTMSFFSSRFSGREIAPVSWPLIGSLLLLLGGKISLGTHSVYAFSFSLFVLFVSIAFCRVAKFSLFTSAFFIALIFTSFGPIPSRYHWLDQVWMWPMNSYGVYDFFSLACVIVYLKIYLKLSDVSIATGSKNKMPYFLISFAALLFFLFSLNSVRGFLVVSGGVIAAAAFDILVKEDCFSKKYLKEWIVVAVVTTTSLVGLILIRYLTKGVPQPWVDPHKFATISNWLEFRDRLISILWTWLTLFNAIPVNGSSMFSTKNIVRISNTFFALFLFALPLFRLKSISGNVCFLAKAERLLIYKFLFLLLMLLISSVYGTSAWFPRYLLPLAYSAIFVFPFGIESWIRNRKFGAIVMVFALFIPAYVVSLGKLTRYSADDYKKNEFYGLAMFLEKEGLTFGFAGPWHSDVITVNYYSSGKVRIALIDPENDKLQPHRHADKISYESFYHNGLTFIALPEDISSTNKKNLEIRVDAIKTLNYGGWVIDVYPTNIAQFFDNKF